MNGTSARFGGQFLTCLIFRLVLEQPATSSTWLHAYCLTRHRAAAAPDTESRAFETCRFVLQTRCRPNIKILIPPPPQPNLKLNSSFLSKGGDMEAIFSLILTREKKVYKRGAAILREISKRKCSPENRPTLLYSAYQ